MKINCTHLVVGSGLAGAVIARRIAEELNEEVLVIDKRNHIGGNCYDHYNDQGILIHKYGPHIFHTNNEQVWKFLSKFTEWNEYQHKVLSYTDGIYVPMPININTFNKLYNVDLSTEDFLSFLKKLKKDNFIKDIKTAEDSALSIVGPVVYEAIFKHYTEKQWGLSCKDLLPSLMSRIPIRHNKDDRYFSDKYQGIPKEGYTSLINNILNHKKIKVLLNKEFDKGSFDYKYLYYSGEVDKFYDYKHGKIKYRSLNFKFETLNMDSYQDVATVNYPKDYDFTRITEFKKLTSQNVPNKTCIVKEYPSETGDPYYIVPTPDNTNIIEKYYEEMKKDSKVSFIGRLGQCKYLNMDQAIDTCLGIKLTPVYTY